MKIFILQISHISKSTILITRGRLLICPFSEILKIRLPHHGVIHDMGGLTDFRPYTVVIGTQEFEVEHDEAVERIEFDVLRCGGERV